MIATALRVTTSVLQRKWQNSQHGRGGLVRDSCTCRITHEPRSSESSCYGGVHAQILPQQRVTDTASTQSSRLESDSAGHLSDHWAHTTCSLAAALLITKLLAARSYPPVCILQQAQCYLRLDSGLLPSMPTHMR